MPAFELELRWNRQVTELSIKRVPPSKDIMRHAIALTMLFFISSGCEWSNHHIPETVSEARARWSKSGFDSYTIEKTRACECLPPYSYAAVVVDGNLIDVRFDLPEQEEKPRSLLHESREHLLATVMTIEELFDLLEYHETNAARFEVQFHHRFGYPTKVFIDPHFNIADDEIIRELSNLERITK